MQRRCTKRSPSNGALKAAENTARYGRNKAQRGYYREMKQALGLGHFEGRTWSGWHHHVTLVSAAHAFCTLQRLTQDPKRRSAGLSLYQVVRDLQTLLATWTGACRSSFLGTPTASTVWRALTRDQHVVIS
ncbi:hypothetical protein [Streptomyces sp. NPDC052127]|uniref:hypothetical protein n=1 Tax=Streptomyces sp. NPDC052127 TaxID=3155679 RepID=UPI00342308CB